MEPAPSAAGNHLAEFLKARAAGTAVPEPPLGPRVAPRPQLPDKHGLDAAASGNRRGHRHHSCTGLLLFCIFARGPGDCPGVPSLPLHCQVSTQQTQNVDPGHCCQQTTALLHVPSMKPWWIECFSDAGIIPQCDIYRIFPKCSHLQECSTCKAIMPSWELTLHGWTGSEVLGSSTWQRCCHCRTPGNPQLPAAARTRR